LAKVLLSFLRYHQRQLFDWQDQPIGPPIDNPWHAMERAAMWKAVEVSSPAILYMLGIIRSRPCEEVNVQARAPV
jgi:hypothetical protein